MNKKKWSVITAAALLLSSAAVVAGIFQWCTAQPDGGAFINRCEIYGGDCGGYCSEIVITGKMACENSINPYCGGSSLELWTRYNGTCEGDECVCVIDYSSPFYDTLENECD